MDLILNFNCFINLTIDFEFDFIIILTENLLNYYFELYFEILINYSLVKFMLKFK
jgi:hypothetical protein